MNATNDCYFLHDRRIYIYIFFFIRTIKLKYLKNFQLIQKVFPSIKLTKNKKKIIIKYFNLIVPFKKIVFTYLNIQSQETNIYIHDSRYVFLIKIEVLKFQFSPHSTGLPHLFQFQQTGIGTAVKCQEREMFSI